MIFFRKKIPNPQKRKYIISSRKFKDKNAYTSLKKAVQELKLCNIEDVNSVFGFVREFSPLYGGRLYQENKGLSWQDVDLLKSKGISVSLTLSGHYFDETKYQATRSILDRLYHKQNSLVITNDELAVRIKKDYPDYILKASVIKSIKTNQEIEKTLQLYDYIALDPKLNDDLEFINNIPYKNKIILFGSIYCLYHCPNSICYKWFSDHMGEKIDPKSQPCTNKHRINEVRQLTRFDFTNPVFNEFKLIKLVV